ncbi:MAG: DUF2911 domain-containing protein [Cyclobacteriaceae bacterium]
MKKIKFGLTALLVAVYFFSATAQDQRASPAMTATGTSNGATITVNYGSPAVKGRKIWGGLEAYDKVWRTGANEATTIQFSKDVNIEGKTIKKGKYALFTIPREGDWTVIINAVPNQWGAYKYDESKNVHTFDVTPEKNAMTERMTFDVSNKGVVSMSWEKLKVSFKVK